MAQNLNTLNREMSKDPTDPALYASSSDALPADYAERHGELGEVQEEADNLECLRPPTDRHIWDGARGRWIREEEYPIELRPHMWKL